MSYANNRSSYNTRNSIGGRYNTTGQFVPAASEQQQQQPSNNTMVQTTNLQQRLQNAAGNGSSQNNQFGQLYSPAAQPQKSSVNQPLQTADVKMEETNDTLAEAAKPSWMKSKLAGVKKISNKERRRRQNETLRRLLTPKNALMVLNEMMPGEAVANQFKVEQAPTSQYFNKNTSTSFCADLTLEGTNYKGYGENKMIARNAAAEQAIRDYIIRRMSKLMGGAAAADTTSVTSAGAESADGGGDEEVLPMIQLASFALHKLFSEWEYEGHKVPQLKPLTGPIRDYSEDDDHSDTLTLEQLQSLVDLEAMAKLQTQDEDLARHLEGGETALSLTKVKVPGTSVELYCDVSTAAPRPFVPQPLRRRVFDGLHALCHPVAQPSHRLARQHRLITKHFVWPLMRKNCREWAMQCSTCFLGKPPAESGAGTPMAVDEAPRAPAPKPAPKPKSLPLNARAMHPATLLSYMRPRLEYKQLAVDGDKPQAMTYTIGVDVDGLTYIGKATNKKEARRAAAKAACTALFNITFDDVATASAPVIA